MEPETTESDVDEITPHQPVVVEPLVNIEKLRELLALKAEYDALDFKSVLDLLNGAASRETRPGGTGQRHRCDAGQGRQHRHRR
ncbi:hypothetical protein [Nonomuraea soli]|uniref:Uncharacterized protein n=1 Tax=Nonomuraea soli TaxID=1032476 RepID=A0A7W0HPI0_9ACTN|nr:hypothetical protein [Nonomuraea soli]MBA2890782.1 hypothetical protein [Nonomuraea soli]